jgi:hypothetical protein
MNMVDLVEDVSISLTGILIGDVNDGYSVLIG